MKRYSTLAFLAALTICVSNAFAQTAQPTATPVGGADDVVKITTKLVQIDVVVTDKKGTQVRDLTADDFELLQDGKRQKITGFSYVGTDAANVTTTVKSAAKDAPKTAAAVPPVRLKPGEAGRIITFVVDDGNCASLTGMQAAKQAVQKFVKEQMLPTDLVAIYKTRSGSSMLQQYTSDKTLLLKVADKIRWYPSVCSALDGSHYEAARDNTFIKMGPGGAQSVSTESPDEKKIRAAREDSITNNQVVGTLGVVRYIVQGLDKVPGRKIVFLISDGMPLRSRNGNVQSAIDAVRTVADVANRASVVINTVGNRGVTLEMAEARDEIYAGSDPRAADKVVAGRISDGMRSEDGLAMLADQTGGEFYKGINTLESLVAEALKRENGYYLLAYEPAEDTFKNKKFNKVEVKLKRPELVATSRMGFFGIPDIVAVTQRKRRTADSELYEAIAAPLPRVGLNVALSAYFVNTAEAGNFVRSIFHLNGKDVTFVDDAGGLKKANLDVVAVTMNEKNEVIDEFTRTHTFKVNEGMMAQIMENGLVYAADVPVKKDGTYNFRVAVRDGNNRSLGSSSEVVTVPDLKTSPLLASGLTVTGTDSNGKFTVPKAPTPETAISLPSSTEVPAIRQFRPGSIVTYLYSVYSARLDATGRAKLTTKVNLYRDGKLIVDGTPQPADLQNQTDWSRIADFGYMQLAKNAELGDYTLQIIVTDLLGGKNATSSQWIDFEVVEK